MATSHRDLELMASRVSCRLAPLGACSSACFQGWRISDLRLLTRPVQILRTALRRESICDAMQVGPLEAPQCYVYKFTPSGEFLVSFSSAPCELHDVGPALGLHCGPARMYSAASRACRSSPYHRARCAPRSATQSAAGCVGLHRSDAAGAGAVPVQGSKLQQLRRCSDRCPPVDSQQLRQVHELDEVAGSCPGFRMTVLHRLIVRCGYAATSSWCTSAASRTALSCSAKNFAW
jgi:hypothetical protein